MEENLQNKKYLTVKELIFYSLGLFGLQAIIFYINSYQVEFYSGSGMIEASKMVIVTFIILAAKLVSAVFDPLIGNLIDSKKGGKHGKLKPFIVISTIPLSILTVLIFCKVNLTGFALYAYIFVTTTLWSVAMTLGDVPSQGMSAVITPNPTERNNLIGFSGTLKSIGQAAPYVVVPAVCLCVPGGAGIEGTISTTEYLWCAIVISVLGSLMFLGIFFFNKERVPYEAERVSLKDMFGIIKNNKYLLLVVASYFLGFARQGAMAIQAQTANAILGGANKIIILGISTAVGTVISMAVTPILIKKFDEKKVFIAMSIYGGVSSVLAYLVAVWTNFNLIALIATLFLMGLQFGAVNIMPMIMVADSVDYYEWKTGKRTEGVAYAVLSLCIKVTLALGAAVCLAWVFADFTGYQANMTEFSDSVKKGVFFSYTVIPGITSALAAIPIFFYDLVGDKKKQISADLAARRGVVE
ncbi:MAG: MFS transporter [Faecalibacterium sp.]|nr:MFS transporter [Faecalibacterium sp.]CCY04700.1 inner membrane symporter yicJ [Faecalibacterium sp. CAG:1138]